MAIYLDEKEEAERRAELEAYDAEKSAIIEEERINAKNKRLKADKKFRQASLSIITVIFVILIIRWLM